jgi:hypothetical protein
MEVRKTFMIFFNFTELNSVFYLHSLRVVVSFGYSNSDGKMERSRLRRCAGMRYADLDPLLAELARARASDKGSAYLQYL